MSYEGKPCKECGKTIQEYSLSGYCRECWHNKRGGKTYPGSKSLKGAKGVVNG